MDCVFFDMIFVISGRIAPGLPFWAGSPVGLYSVAGQIACSALYIAVAGLLGAPAWQRGCPFTRVYMDFCRVRGPSPFSWLF